MYFETATFSEAVDELKTHENGYIKRALGNNPNYTTKHIRQKGRVNL